jgi:hypothetical protein
MEFSFTVHDCDDKVIFMCNKCIDIISCCLSYQVLRLVAMEFTCAFNRSLCFNARSEVRLDNSELHDRLVVLFNGPNGLEKCTISRIIGQHDCCGDFSASTALDSIQHGRRHSPAKDPSQRADNDRLWTLSIKLLGLLSIHSASQDSLRIVFEVDKRQ